MLENREYCPPYYIARDQGDALCCSTNGPKPKDILFTIIYEQKSFKSSHMKVWCFCLKLFYTIK